MNYEMKYEIKFTHDGEETQSGKYSIEAARIFSKRTARYAESCQILDGETVVEVWSFTEEAGFQVQRFNN